ncbi:MAG: single-stranded-DNA-specific exonuclease RecJ [Nevskiales bacterium]|nr:single-stranded-DNA-specific exonuclease RecJ [Nevskiales bacterium]
MPEQLHPVLRRVYAARGFGQGDLGLELSQLLAPGGLLGIDAAAARLAQAIRDRERIVIAGDYDADGATATSVAVLGLRALGAADVQYVVPDRFRMGYGLSPALADEAIALGAQVLVTVDNGISSHAGVERARRAGVSVIVTDHHLPGAAAVPADAIVNPNQPGCAFASKHLAGVGVMFYVLLALRARLRDEGAFGGGNGPNLAELLDLVAIGTVADVVRLDHNNRILVEQGLRRIRAGRTRPGVMALLRAAGRLPAHLTAADIGFGIGPRLNAAGRLDDMRVGIECLLADSAAAAEPRAQSLERFNRDRREIQEQMHFDALELVGAAGVGLTVFHPDWHEGVVGLVASRLKEARHRPVVAFARAQAAGELKGSGRSIPGVHLRDVLAAVDARQPGLILRFGGHAMAAGLSLAEADLAAFERAFDAACASVVEPDQLQRVIETDGPLAAEELTLDTALTLERAGPWGQGCPEPAFDNDFSVIDARPVGSDGRHVRYRLATADDGAVVEAIHFDGAQSLCAGGQVRVAYVPTVNRYRGLEALNLRVIHLEPA